MIYVDGDSARRAHETLKDVTIGNQKLVTTLAHDVNRLLEISLLGSTYSIFLGCRSGQCQVHAEHSRQGGDGTHWRKALLSPAHCAYAEPDGFARYGIMPSRTCIQLFLNQPSGIEKESMPVYTPTPVAAQAAVGAPQSVCVLLSNMFNPAE